MLQSYPSKPALRVGLVILGLGLNLLLAACGGEASPVSLPATPSVGPTGSVAPTIAPPSPTPRVERATPAVPNTSPGALIAATIAAQNRNNGPAGTLTAASSAAAAAAAAAIGAGVKNVTPTAPKTVVQPKVLRTGRDSYRPVIEFTEQPPLADGVPTLIWFDAEGCSACAQMQPMVDQAKAKYASQVKFAVLDFYDQRNRGLAQQFGITTHPNMVLVDGKGLLYKRWAGLIPGGELDSSLQAVRAR